MREGQADAPSDQDLLAAWSRGDVSAGELLYARYFRTVYRYFTRRITHDIDDLVQRTFLACTRHRDRVRDGASFEGFVLVVARNELHAHLRARYRRGQAVELSTTSIADVSETVNQLIIRREEHERLQLALRRIPPDLQEVLTLSYFQRLKGRELAATLNVPEGTVRSRLRRALSAMRIELQVA